MIKTDNGIFYMTAGEACYIARSAGGRLGNVWFGARIEPEDDIHSDARAVDEVSVELGGNKIDLDLRSFEIVDKPDFITFPSARGGETLIVRLSGAKHAVEVDLLYTPYPRGGIARRAVVRNVGNKTVSVKAKLCLSADGAARRERSFIEINGDGTVGVAALYGGKYEFEHSDGALKCGIAEAVDIEQDGVFVTPEILCVHTDGDSGKAARIFHDIVREHIIGERFSDMRRPLPLFCPSATLGKNAADTVAAAKQLGVDSLVIDCGKSAKTKELAAFANDCANGGIRSGVAFDVSSYSDLEKAADTIKNVIESIGADIVVLRKFDHDADYRYWQKAYAFLRRVADASTEPVMSGACDLGSLCYTALCSETDSLTVVPPCARYGLVAGLIDSPKTEFDLASFGCLCYALDIDGLTDGVKRAVRAQVFSYQDDAENIMNGDLYSYAHPSGEITAMVSKDKSSAYAVFRRGAGRAGRIKLFGLDAHNLYHVRELDKTYSGAALRYYGLSAADELDEGETLALHLMQVVDYE